MAKNSHYYQNKELLQKKKLKELKEQLPIYTHPFLNDCVNRGAALSTVVAYAYDLHTFFRYMIEKSTACENMSISSISADILESLTFYDINEYQDYLRFNDQGEQHSNKNNGVARRMAALRSFFRYSVEHHILSSDPTIGSSVTRTKNKDDIIRMNSEEVNDFVDLVRNSNIGSNRQQAFCKNSNLRDTAIAILMLNTGIRVSECVGLDITDINFNENYISIIRKGGKSSNIYFNDVVADALQGYIENERCFLVKDKPEETALFLSNRKQRMCVKAMENVIKKYAKVAVPNKKITAHKLRSTFGTSLYAETSDIYLVADALGHSSINTTKAAYTALEETHRKEIGKLSLYGNK